MTLQTVKQKNSGMGTPLYVALRQRHSQDIIKKIFKEFPNAAAYTIFGDKRTMLYYALKYSHPVEIVNMIWKEYPRAMKKVGNGKELPIEVAFQSGCDYSVLKLLMYADFPIDKKGGLKHYNGSLHCIAASTNEQQRKVRKELIVDAFETHREHSIALVISVQSQSKLSIFKDMFHLTISFSLEESRSGCGGKRLDRCADSRCQRSCEKVHIFYGYVKMKRNN